MANEISTNIQLQVRKGSLSVGRTVSKAITMTGNHYQAGVQTIGFAAHEAVTVESDIGTEGVCLFVNTDATNFVQIGVDVAATFYPLIKLKAGEVCMGRLATGTFYAQADTGAVRLEKWIIED